MRQHKIGLEETHFLNDTKPGLKGRLKLAIRKIERLVTAANHLACAGSLAPSHCNQLLFAAFVVARSPICQRHDFHTAAQLAVQGR
jgi:hypothetical protein